MNYLKKLIRDWLTSDVNQAGFLKKDRHVETAMSLPYLGPGTRCINFTLRPATGGWVIEASRYDHHTDRQEMSLYVLTDFDTLGSELAKIISLESLKQ
jgi:hypothetical protein